MIPRIKSLETKQNYKLKVPVMFSTPKRKSLCHYILK